MINHTHPSLDIYREGLLSPSSVDKSGFIQQVAEEFCWQLASFLFSFNHHILSRLISSVKMHPAAMALSKDRISSPLEAGPSILDVQNLPPHLNEALEYASRRLTRKALHVTLVVVRRDYQLPTIPPPCASPDLSPPSSPSPHASRLAFATSPVAALRHLVKSGGSTGGVSHGFPAPLPSPAPESEFGGQRYMRWPLSPSVPLSPPPMTPSTTTSSTATDNGPMTPNPFGLRLIHANLLNAREEKILRQTIDKAEKRFHIG